MERIRTVLQEAGIPVSDRQLTLLEEYYQMVIAKNQVMNLTAITEREEFILLHFLDSLAPLYADAGLRELFGFTGDSSAPKKVRLIDVGTGAGFPGIPLKIICPHLEVTLLDSLQKRVLFLNEVAEQLSLTGITAIHSRAEDGARQPVLRDSFDLAVSRAVANLSALSEYVLPLVRTGGHFLSYKSGEVADELKQAGRALRLLGGRAEDPVYTELPGAGEKRSFILIRKERPTPKTYPRKAGTAKKDPL